MSSNDTVSRRTAAARQACAEIKGVSYAAIREQPELLAEYTAECSIPGLGPTNPQWGMYDLLEEAGTLRCFAVFRGAAMVGFATVLVAVLPHYGVNVATTESFFVTQAHRDTTCGARLFRAVREYAASAGCRHVFYTAPAGGQLEALLARRYRRTSSVFCEALG